MTCNRIQYLPRTGTIGGLPDSAPQPEIGPITSLVSPMHEL